jgi:hypothetical protein
MTTRIKGSALYKELQNAYDDVRQENTENFFVSYAVRGPSFVNQYGGVQYDMPLKHPLDSCSTVSEPSPLNSEYRISNLENPYDGVK